MNEETRKRVRKQVEETRKAQGLPPNLEDETVLAELAAAVFESMISGGGHGQEEERCPPPDPGGAEEDEDRRNRSRAR